MKRLLCFLLVLLFCTLPLAGCKGEKDGTDETNESSEETETSENNDGDGEEYYLDTLPKNTYGYNDINIATIPGNVCLDEQPEDADVVDAERYKRDFRLEEHYNIEINYVEIPLMKYDSEEVEFMITLIQGDSTKVDFFVHQPDMLMSLALNGLAADLRQIDNLALEKEWWSQSLNYNLTFGNSQFVAAGPVSELYYGAVLAMAYNKEMATDLGIGNMYDIVTEGTWTLERLKSICTEYELTDKDAGTYTIVFDQGVGPYGLFASAGGNFATFDDEKNIVVNLTDDKSVGVLEKVTAAFHADHTFFGGIYETSPKFTSGNALFYYTTVGYMENFLPMSEVNYGIIPCPKFDEGQKDYISCGWPSSSFATAVPVTLSDDRMEWAGLFLEAYCFLGYDMIKPVKYDALVLHRVALDEETSELLDLIFKDVYFDLNLVANLGGSRDFIGTTIKQGMNKGYVGSMKGLKTLIDADIATYAALVGKS